MEKVETVDGKAVASGKIRSGEVAGFPVCGEDTLFVYGYAKEWASEAVTIGVADRRQQ